MKQIIIRARYYLMESARCSHRHETNQSFLSLLRLFFRWNRSLASTPLQNGLPWISYSAIDFLNKVLTPEMRVFEWGAGGSTIFFSHKVKELVSVEHDLKWAKDIRGRKDSFKSACWQLFEVTPLSRDHSVAPDAADPKAYASAAQSYEELCFREYASAIDQFADGYFDIIQVDGRCRPSCVMHAIPKVKPGGYLILDDAARPRYIWVHQEMNRLCWREINLVGPGPHKWEFSQTMAWQKPF